MTKPSVGQAWEDTLAFLRRQHSLVVPIGLAFFSLPSLVFDWARPAVPAGADPLTTIVVGPWMLWSIPLVLAYVFGSLAVSALATGGDRSVREALDIARRRFGTGVGIIACGFVVLVLAALVLTLLGPVLAGGRSDPTAGMGSAVTILFILLLVIVARLLPIWALVADRAPRAVAALRETVRLTRGATVKLLGVIVLFSLVSAIIRVAIQFTLGAVLVVAGRLAGNAAAGEFLVLLVDAVVSGLLTTALTLYCAMLYRRMVSSSGT